MKSFHDLNISHRDIKLENVLVDLQSDNIETKIIDFGFATQVADPSTKQTAFCGTPAYMSPQMCAKKDYYGPPVDIWATGILLYTILFGT